MKRMILFAALLTPLIASSTQPARADDAGVSLRIGDRYHGTSLSFTTRPRMTVVPRTRVYYMQGADQDVYRYGRYYYGYDQGRWYRSSTYSGPWVYVRGRTVPRQIYSVPPDYRRHWEGDYNYWRTRDYDDRWEQYQGNGANRDGNMTPSETGEHR
jgi:hypothetical protein